MCLIGTLMRVCPHQSGIGAIGSQRNMPKGLYIFGNFHKLGNHMYLVTKYM